MAKKGLGSSDPHDGEAQLDPHGRESKKQDNAGTNSVKGEYSIIAVPGKPQVQTTPLKHTMLFKALIMFRSDFAHHFPLKTRTDAHICAMCPLDVYVKTKSMNWFEHAVKNWIYEIVEMYTSH
jgi:hypothetical protein